MTLAEAVNQSKIKNESESHLALLNELNHIVR